VIDARVISVKPSKSRRKKRALLAWLLCGVAAVSLPAARQTTGVPADRHHRGNKAETSGLSWHPSGLSPSGAASQEAVWTHVTGAGHLRGRFAPRCAPSEDCGHGGTRAHEVTPRPDVLGPSAAMAAGRDHHGGVVPSRGAGCLPQPGGCLQEAVSASTPLVGPVAARPLVRRAAGQAGGAPGLLPCRARPGHRSLCARLPCVVAYAYSPHGSALVRANGDAPTASRRRAWTTREALLQ